MSLFHALRIGPVVWFMLLTTAFAEDASIPLIDISAGGSHACAIGDGNESGFCWGSNRNGELGDGNAVGSSVPVAVVAPGSGAWLQVTTGSSHSCAIQNSTETPFCWGSNLEGLLGDGSYQDQNRPAPVGGGAAQPTVKQISAGYKHTCAITKNATVICWGANDYGQLGDGSMVSRNVPTPALYGEDGWQQVSSGYLHTCGLQDDGTAWCWGRNSEGQVGDGSRTDALAPSPVFDVGKWIQLSAGYDHTCGLKVDNTAWCWGSNNYGQLGSGEGSGIGNSTKPVKVSGDTTWVQIQAGRGATCGISSDSIAYCWGNTVSAVDIDQNNATLSTSSAPQAINLETNASAIWRQISVSALSDSFFACGIAEVSGSGVSTGFCWGSNAVGQLGSKGPNSNTPRAVGPWPTPAAAPPPTSKAVTQSVVIAVCMAFCFAFFY